MGAAAITGDFERVWPSVATRLHRMLAARGLGPDRADDICQEVAWRVLSRDISYQGEADLYPWAATVARRLSIDLYRHDRHVAPVEPPDRPVPHDLVDVVESRSRLQAVADAMPALSEADRVALMAPATDAGAMSRRESVKLAVRRHRARARLLALVEASAAIVAWVVSRLPVRRSGRVVGAAALAACPAFMLALSFSALAPETGEPPQAESVPADRVSSTGPEQATSAPRSVPPPSPPTPTRAPLAAEITDQAAMPAAPRAMKEHVVARAPDGRRLVAAREREAEGEPLLCVKRIVVEHLCVDL